MGTAAGSAGQLGPLSGVVGECERFPADFMLLLTEREWEDLKCQIGISKSGHGGRKRVQEPTAAAPHRLLALHDRDSRWFPMKAPGRDS